MLNWTEGQRRNCIVKIKAKERYRNTAGVIIPSVTTVLNELNKPALISWANRIGLDGIDMNKYKDELADVGTLTHYFIICRLKDEVPDISEYTPEQVQLAEDCFKQYIEWESKNPVMCVLAEEPLISERYQYGGRLDLCAVCNKELMLADFKTNAKGIFPEMIYQVSAYRQLLLEAGYNVKRTIILRLGRGGQEGADEKILTPYELDNGFQIFLRCLDIYRLKRGDSFMCTEVRV